MVSQSLLLLSEGQAFVSLPSDNSITQGDDEYQLCVHTAQGANDTYSMEQRWERFCLAATYQFGKMLKQTTIASFLLRNGT